MTEENPIIIDDSASSSTETTEPRTPPNNPRLKRKYSTCPSPPRPYTPYRDSIKKNIEDFKESPFKSNELLDCEKVEKDLLLQKLQVLDDINNEDTFYFSSSEDYIWDDFDYGTESNPIDIDHPTALEMEWYNFIPDIEPPSSDEENIDPNIDP